MQTEKPFELLLHERHFEAPGAGWEARIIGSAKDRRHYIFKNTVDAFREFVISVMPQKAPAITFMAILLMGLAIGVSLPAIKTQEMASAVADEEVL